MLRGPLKRVNTEGIFEIYRLCRDPFQVWTLFIGTVFRKQTFSNASMNKPATYERHTLACAPLMNWTYTVEVETVYFKMHCLPKPPVYSHCEQHFHTCTVTAESRHGTVLHCIQMLSRAACELRKHSSKSQETTSYKLTTKQPTVSCWGFHSAC